MLKIMLLFIIGFKVSFGKILSGPPIYCMPSPPCGKNIWAEEKKDCDEYVKTVTKYKTILCHLPDFIDKNDGIEKFNIISYEDPDFECNETGFPELIIKGEI